MPHPDADLYPDATGLAEQLVKKHSEPRRLSHGDVQFEQFEG